MYAMRRVVTKPLFVVHQRKTAIATHAANTNQKRLRAYMNYEPWWGRMRVVGKEFDMKEWELINYLNTTKMLSSECPYVAIYHSKGVRKKMCNHNKNYRKRKDCSYVNCPIKKEKNRN